jgi:hypothetical protein
MLIFSYIFMGFIIGVIYTRYRLYAKKEIAIYTGNHTVYNAENVAVDTIKIVSECYVLNEINGKVKIKPIAIQLDNPEYNNDKWISICENKLYKRWVSSSSLERSKKSRKEKISEALKNL